MNEDVQITSERGEEVFFERAGAVALPNLQSEDITKLDKIKSQLMNPYIGESPKVESSKAYRAPGTRDEQPAPAPTTVEAGTKGKYVPPSRRTEGSASTGPSAHGRDQAATVRVSNLSDQITDSDLRNVFGKIGPIERSYLALDHVTRQSKGFAFITYASREDAQKAIDKLNGFKWDYLVISVEWAKN